MPVDYMYGADERDADARGIVSGLNAVIDDYLPGPDTVVAIIKDFSTQQGWEVPYLSSMDRNPAKGDPAFMHVDHWGHPAYVVVLGLAPGTEDTIVEDPDAHDGVSAGAEAALDWARSKLGEYEEIPAGSNRGPELDDLQQEFGFLGTFWCAMFTSKAISDHGGVTSACRTASVPQINNWCAAGTNGYEQGFKTDPKPGDLMTFGGDHVALVEKVGRTQVTTIEGNTGSNHVARRVRGRGTGTYVRPEYP